MNVIYVYVVTMHYYQLTTINTSHDGVTWHAIKKTFQMRVGLIFEGFRVPYHQNLKNLGFYRPVYVSQN